MSSEKKKRSCTTLADQSASGACAIKARLQRCQVLFKAIAESKLAGPAAQRYVGIDMFITACVGSAQVQQRSIA